MWFANGDNRRLNFNVAHGVKENRTPIKKLFFLNFVVLNLGGTIVKKIHRSLSYRAVALGVLCACASSVSAESICDLRYSVITDWGAGATHNVSFTYSGPEIEGWQLTWAFPGNEKIATLWGGFHTQDGQSIVVNNADWNGKIRAGSEVLVGFNINAPSGTLPAVLFNGVSCDGPTDEGDEDVVDDQQDQNNDNEDSDDGDNDAIESPWSLASDDSFLNYLTYKNISRAENNRFETLGGAIDEDGNASLIIDLNSVNTGVTIRDTRVRDLLFETSVFPTATVTLQIDPNLLDQLSVGEQRVVAVSAVLDLHGLLGVIDTQLSLQKVTTNKLMVQNVSPLLIRAADYSLESGIESLRQIANLQSISTTVPTDFVLFYQR